MHDSSYNSRVGVFGHIEAVRDDEHTTDFCNDYRDELNSFHEFLARDAQSGQALPDTLVGSMSHDVSAVVARSGLEFESMFRVDGEL